jgi:hypothetical protein
MLGWAASMDEFAPDCSTSNFTDSQQDTYLFLLTASPLSAFGLSLAAGVVWARGLGQYLLAVGLAIVVGFVFLFAAGVVAYSECP